MKVLGLSILEEYGESHADVRSALGAWLDDVEEAEWKTPADIKRRYASASFLANNVVVFNIKGNSFRIVVSIAYRAGIVRIKRVGTHAEYSKWRI